MTTTSVRDDETDTPREALCVLDDYVRAFERAYARRGGADPAAYLPPDGHPLHAAVLRELVRVDLEYGWERGRPKDLAEYQSDFPGLAADGDGLREIAFEEFRLRRLAGQNPSPDEYLTRYGVRLDPAAVRFRATGAAPHGDDGHSLALPPYQGGGSPGHPEAPPLPEVGDDFAGFRLIAEIGRGAFGRVYLARQGDLADRPVVLKVTADAFDESQTLAQLQHDNIVPVYSRHRDGRLRAICMPYLGSVTLRDVVEDLKGQGAMPGSGRGLLTSLGKTSVRRGMRLPPAAAAAAAAPHAAPGRTPAQAAGADAPGDNRAMLGKLTYVEAVVWMGARLADGLAHAHERGILHRDMKPANVLLTDDGRPMLLDFNLAEDLKLRAPGYGAPGAIGGTLPYMAPEHLAAFEEGARPVDARSDLYAFGVILFEMLTGRPPFPVRDGVRPDVVRAMIDDRRGPPPRLRPWNPAVSPAVESVVRRCLDPDPARRYASARELGEDLQRHLAHRPLRYAPDPSPRERLGKWWRRNRVPAVAAALLAAALAGVGGSALVAASRADRLERLEAWAALGRFRRGSAAAMNLMSTAAGSRDLARWRQGRAAAGLALAEFHARDEPAPAAPWWDRPPANRLAPTDRHTLRDEAGELLLVLARSEIAEADTRADPDDARRLYADAGSDSARAEVCFEPGAAPRAVWVQRAELLGKRGDARGAARAAARAGSAPPAGAGDFLARGLDLLQLRQPAAALPPLETAVRLAPDRYRAWLVLGNCHAALLHWEQAESCYSTCIALWPEHPSAWSNRGVALRLRNQPGPALSDFRKALALRPDDTAILADCALAALDLGRPAEAARGFDAVIDRGPADPRVYFMRADARRRLGDPEGAARDSREGLRREPVDEPGWVARALNKVAAGDDPGALADLDRALAVNPDSYKALQNRAYVLSERLGRTGEGLAALGRILELYPDRADTRSDRAVLLARLGRREPALADSDRATALQPTPRLQWQAACVHALTARPGSDDRAEAVGLLASALRQAPALVDQVETDPDLNAIRTEPGYARIIARAKAARARAVAAPPVPGIETDP